MSGGSVHEPRMCENELKNNLLLPLVPGFRCYVGILPENKKNVNSVCYDLTTEKCVV